MDIEGWIALAIMIIYVGVPALTFDMDGEEW